MEGTRTTFGSSPRSGPSSPSPTGTHAPPTAGTHAPPTAGTHISPPAIVFTVDEIRQFTNNFERLIGQGGFGDIYRGHLEDQDIVVKASRVGQAKREEWQKEIEFLQMCNHPNVIKLLGVGEDPAEARFFLVYPHFGKGALRNNIADLQWPQVIKILRGIAAGLDHIHSATPAIIHCDLKPDNILLDTENAPIICDFGAAAREGGTMEYFTVGYQSTLYPGEVGPWNDIFSLGVIILQLMKKQNSPFSEGPEEQHISESVGQAQKKSKEIAGSLRRSGCLKKEGKQIIKLGLTCTAINPTHRPSTREVLQDLNYPESSRSKKFFDKLRYKITRS